MLSRSSRHSNEAASQKARAQLAVPARRWRTPLPKRALLSYCKLPEGGSDTQFLVAVTSVISRLSSQKSEDFQGEPRFLRYYFRHISAKTATLRSGGELQLTLLGRVDHVAATSHHQPTRDSHD
jgi:hypothetical protein